MANETNTHEYDPGSVTIDLSDASKGGPATGRSLNHPPLDGGGPINDSPRATVLEGPAGHQKVDIQGAGEIGGGGVGYQFRCKICQLAIKAPTLYEALHKMVLQDHMSYNGAMNEINTRIKQDGLHMAFLNAVNIHGHFKKHISLEQRTAMQVIKTVMNPAPNIPAMVQSIQPMIQAAVGSEVDDFRNLDILRTKVSAQLEKLELQLDVPDPTKPGSMKLDKFALQLYQKMVAETRACINDLNAMRQSERLMRNVVQSLLERMTFTIIPQLLVEYETIVEELQHAGVQETVWKAIDLRLRTKSAVIISQTARSAVEEVQKQFKIK